MNEIPPDITKNTEREHHCGVRPQSETRWQRFKRGFGLGKKRREIGDDPFCIWLSRVSWRIGPLPKEMDRPTATKIIGDALGYWSQECGFEVDPFPSTGNVDMFFGWYSDKRKSVLFGNTAYAYLPCESKPGDVYFNTDEYWDEDFLHKFALHEIGHAIGLRNHSSDTQDIMQKSPDKTMGVLSANDVKRAVSLYGRERNNGTEIGLV